jgi:signal transduction histidine kinase
LAQKAMLIILKRLRHSWWTGDATGGDQAIPAEAIALRCLGFGSLIVFASLTLTAHPRPALHGRGLLVLAGAVVLVAGAAAVRPLRVRLVERAGRAPAGTARTIAGLVGVIIGAVLLEVVQPHGIWQIGPYFVAIVAAVRSDRRTGLLMLAAAIAPFAIVALIAGHKGTALSVSLGILPWFLLLRLMRRLIVQRDELDASRAAEARAAAAAERGRLAREMHDVLAHSLSALALQLETTRLLARDRGVDDEITRAIDQAHELAATGLDDARRAIAAARGDVLPGPERIEALADAFGAQSGLPVTVEVRGRSHELASDARLAVYRTAQEALTNVRRHATPDSVRISLDYLPDSTVLVIEDRAAGGTSTPTAAEVGGGYGLAGMRERAELLGGELSASPTIGGFRVELRVPAAHVGMRELDRA